MDRSREYHTCEVSQRERQICDRTFMWNLENNTNASVCKTEADTQTQRQIYGYQRGKRGGRCKLGVWGYQIETTTYKVNKQQGIIV